MTRSVDVRESSSRTAELSEKMEGERKERERGGRERDRKRTLLMAFSLSRQRRSSLEVYERGRALSRSRVSPPGFGGRGPVRAAVINNAAINPGLSPAGMTAFGKKRRERERERARRPRTFILPPLSSPLPLSFLFPSLSLCLYLSFSFDERT